MSKHIITPKSFEYSIYDNYGGGSIEFLNLYFYIDGKQCYLPIKKSISKDILFYSGVTNNFWNLFGLEDIGGDSFCFKDFVDKKFKIDDIVKVVEYVWKEADKKNLDFLTAVLVPDNSK